ncbi:hypothetical protein ACOI1H_19140 [Loktanella sp. DJP18]|uniref:hypothetical protein n=1 Tax=Loktanella sp. DJP18 TaxID=3409788 RepID=UPI003BB6676B
MPAFDTAGAAAPAVSAVSWAKAGDRVPKNPTAIERQTGIMTGKRIDNSGWDEWEKALHARGHTTRVPRESQGIKSWDGNMENGVTPQGITPFVS